ncbi:hypothetical protein PVAP13_6KG218400 [Panicum virgatum]|uniref:Uncharacterized protein n=1 Tax=Panicum virgatum TaxID=38727 RepID=A0A8T0RF26_PANVG|nr:hypothetical protein PVAP13_6KG218400 [Panicum virgatum]
MLYTHGTVAEPSQFPPDSAHLHKFTRTAVALLAACALLRSSRLEARAPRGDRPAMFATAARWAAKKGRPKMARIQLTVPPEQAQSITRAIFDIVRGHGPLTISDVWPVWDHVKVLVLWDWQASGRWRSCCGG